MSSLQWTSLALNVLIYSSLNVPFAEAIVMIIIAISDLTGPLFVSFKLVNLRETLE